jgi:RNA polymerase sigma-70 factor (ECF subfamily)
LTQVRRGRPVTARTPPLRLIPSGPDSGPDDASIVAGLVAGEEWAASLEWRRYAAMVYGLFDRALGSSVDSEDLTQDVFAGAFAAMGRLRDPSALRSFLYSCAVRRLQAHLRAKRIRRWLVLSEAGELPEPPPSPFDAEARDHLASFYRLLDELRPEDRTAYVLRYIEDLALQEIADAIGASRATVKRRIARAAQAVYQLARAHPELAAYVVTETVDDP